MKRKFEEETIAGFKRQKQGYDPILAKRKSDMDLFQGQAKRRRHVNDEMDALRRRNFELEQAVTALVNKVSTLEYMLLMFQRNETIGSNRLISAY